MPRGIPFGSNMVFANNAIYCPKSAAIDAQGIGNATFSANYVKGRLVGVKTDGSRFCDGGTIYKAFVEPDKKNYWPKLGSVLINHADPDFAPNLDFNHAQRKPPFDVGAYESEGYAKNPGWQVQMGFKGTRLIDKEGPSFNHEGR